MKAKEQKAKEYTDNLPLCEYKDIDNAFKAGWDAALDYFSSLPFDKMLEQFDEHFKEKEERND